MADTGLDESGHAMLSGGVQYGSALLVAVLGLSALGVQFDGYGGDRTRFIIGRLLATHMEDSLLLSAV